MAINIYETPIQPIVNLDSDVVVYVPGYAIMGPSEPTFVTSATFSNVFGSTPYIFKQSQLSTIPKNSRQATQSEKSWLYAKALTDAGLTVLYHRFQPTGVLVAKAEKSEAIVIQNNGGAIEGKVFNVRAKYFGSYYKDMYVSFLHSGLGIVKVSVFNVVGGTKIEERVVSFNPTALNYIGTTTFTNIVFYTGDYGEANYLEGFEALNLEDYYAANPSAVLYSTSNATLTGAFPTTTVYTLNEEGDYIGVLEGTVMEYTQIITTGVEPNTFTKDGDTYTPAEDGTWVLTKADPLTYTEKVVSGANANLYRKTTPFADEFSISEFEANLASATGMLSVVADTNKYMTITYLTTGGYFQDTAIAGNLMNIAAGIKALAPIDLCESVSDVNAFTALQATVLSIPTTSVLNYSFGYMDVGADTYVPNGIRTIMPDSFGGLLALAGNIAAGLPAWLPIANNSQGSVSSAIASTRPISRAVQNVMISDIGVSVNPIVNKQNTGYVIMGNRTLYPNAGVLGPQSFKNCRFVVNSVERAARRAADSLLISSTNATATFRTFVSMVEKTIQRMLVNGDGLNAYSITKLPKTKPATIDVEIRLVVVEGIETFNINIPYSINMEA